MQADHAGYNNQIHSKSGPEIASSLQILLVEYYPKISGLCQECLKIIYLH